MMTSIVERLFPVEPSDLLPALTPDNAMFWSSLQDGELVLQRCDDCHRFRYPIMPVCPHCSSEKFRWHQASGQGKIFSWVRYHRSYLPEFEPLMPYVVATIELEENVRMFGLFKSSGEPRIGMEVGLIIEKWPDGRCVPAFEPATGTKS
jgi:hypothetical protein